MSDKYIGLTVVLNGSTDENTTKAIINAIQMIKGVLKVTPLQGDSRDYINREIVKSELMKDIYEVISKK